MVRPLAGRAVDELNCFDHFDCISPRRDVNARVIRLLTAMFAAF